MKKLFIILSFLLISTTQNACLVEIEEKAAVENKFEKNATESKSFIDKDKYKPPKNG